VKTYFSFGLQAPVIILFILIIILAVLTYYYYRRVKTGISRPLFIFLVVNRIIIFTLLILCLWQPRLVTEYEEKLKNAYIAVVADNSKSMSIPDGTLKPASTRMDNVNTLLAGESVFRKGLDVKIVPERQRFYEFADKTRKMAVVGKSEPSGPRTNFKELVKKISADAEGLPSAGVILFSDGNDTAGNDLAGLAYELKAKRLPVYAVGIGGGKEFKDIEIASFNGPEDALEKTLLSLKTVIKYSGTPVRQLPVILKENFNTVETKYVDFDGKNTATLTFNILAGAPGVKSYSVEIPPQKGEIFKENNMDSWNVTVKKAPAMKALFVSHQPDFDMMYIKGSAKELKIKYASALQTGPNIFKSQVLEGFGSLKKGFPESKEDLFKYNVIILNNVDFSIFKAEQLEWMVDFVKNKKGGLLLFGQNRNPAKAGVLADILPVELGTAVYKFPEKGFPMSITPEGRAHEIFGMEGKIEKALTPELKSFESFVEVKGLKAGSELLAKITDTQNKDNPFIVAEKVGGGRVLFFAGGDFWRWKMLSEPSAKLYENFWRNAMVWLAVSNVKQDGINITTDKSKYTAGESAEIKVECINPDGDNIKNLKLKGVLESITGKKENIELSENSDGKYTGRSRLKEAGVSKITVEGVLLAGTDKEKSSILVSVKSGDEEFRNIGLNETALKRFAVLSGGEYTTPDKLESIFSKIEKGTETQVKKSSARDLWDSPWIITIILLLFAAELAIRKWKALF